MSRSMTAAVFDGTQRLVLTELPIQEPADNEVLIEIDSATICGTDLHILEGKFESKPPVVLGHEFSGRVAKTGSLVRNCTVGDLVSVEPHIYCGRCKPCRTGKPHLCTDRLAWGINLNGGFAQYATVRDDVVYHVPAGLSGEEAALAELLGCVMNGIERLAVGIGDAVVILGGGAAGILLAKLAQKRGAAQIIFSEPNEARREAILELGYRHVFDPGAVDLAQEIEKLTEGGADVVIDAAGVPATAELAPRLAARAGRILFFGVMAPGRRIEIEPNLVFSRELSILGSIRNPFTHHRILQLMPQLGLDGLITHRFGLDQIQEAFDAARQGAGLKICIKPNG
ncbi:zinc-dependent alcohol dehydrogenase family protein [Consotaella salsifontis]|uniref:2-desacetyl-2-hydroxyethyl bacteriochlorophyllide A dehydrogenase n=1 Tax=Consotaella salsifontis TaxID=1365950 RepID=A0A1T4SF78_9HYPH|nr:zinc-dependent alcohol dehydrogenase family protein [Consotaella salsifontis]SKA27000.1 2-desacetyl-2-hydroxyethyl bacteriochlorophyllide A dehydrogenase [Consotaella salsifontis]